MAALTADRDTHEYVPNSIEYEWPVADNVKIFNGAMIGFDANGRLAPCTLSTTIKPIGRSIEFKDNTVVGHTAGGITCKFHIGRFRWNNVGSITIASRGQLAYAADDQSVQLASTGASAAGPIVDVDSSGVWIEMGFDVPSTLDPATTRSVIACPIPAYSAIANAGVLLRLTPGFAGRILGMAVQTTTPVTTAAKLATLTPNIAGVAVTGGVVSMTSAGQTPIGAVQNGTPVTALNTFTAAQEITVVASAVTAFVEGAGVIYLVLG